MGTLMAILVGAALAGVAFWLFGHFALIVEVTVLRPAIILREHTADEEEEEAKAED